MVSADRPKDSSRTLSAAEIVGLFEAANSSGAETGKVQVLLTTLRERAAVQGAFAPADLVRDLPGSPELEDALGLVIGDSAPITIGDERQWLLEPGPRREALDRLGPERARALLETLPRRKRADPMSAAIEAMLRNQEPDPSRMATSADWRTLVNAAQWCEPASPVAARGLSGWREELQQRELEEPFRNLVGGLFVGREAELKALRDYVDVVPPSGSFEGWERWLSSALRFGARKPLAIQGIGGIGKSTLMAHFILEHAAVRNERRFPFVYLDFDRSTLDPRNPATLVAEALRQLEAQFPAVREEIADLRGALQVQIRRSRAQQRAGSALQGETIYADQRAVASTASQLVDFVKRTALDNRPFLLVLDTFEEAQARGVADAVFDWLAELSALPSLRTVIAGRAPMEEKKVGETLALGNFNKKASLAFLEHHGLRPHEARRVHSLVGGNALSLRLAIRLAQAGDVKSLDDPEMEGGWFTRLDDIQIQGYLHKRLLRHIRDPEVRKLAHPGLVLRRITRPIIRDVLAPVVGIPLALGDEDRLYEGLRREVSLVTQEHDALLHRRDVRAVMLALQRKKEPEAFVRLNEAAVAYYRRLGPDAPDAERTELAYHLLMLDEDPIRVLAAQSIPVLRGLGTSIDELPKPAALLVRLVLGHSLTKAEVRQLPDKAWQIHAFQRASALTTSGAAEAALELLSERKLPRGDPLLDLPRALAQFQTLEWKEAEGALQRVAAERLPLPALPVELTGFAQLHVRAGIELGFLQWYTFRDAAAKASFQRALANAAGTFGPMLRIEALLGAALSEGGDAGHMIGGGWQSQLSQLVGRISIADWRESLLTLSRAVFLGVEAEQVAGAAVQHLGLRLRSPGQIEKFLGEFRHELGGRLQVALAKSWSGPRTDRSDRELSRLEREAGSTVASSKDAVRRLQPYLRGRFATWHVPLRIAILSTFSKPASIAPFLEEAFPDLHRASQAMRPRTPREFVDGALDAAEDYALVLPLLETCIDNSDADSLGQAEMLLRALRRYTRSKDAPRGPRHESRSGGATSMTSRALRKLTSRVRKRR